MLTVPAWVAARRRERFPALYAAGHSFTTIARRLRVHRNTVRLWARRLGLPAPPDRYGGRWREACRKAVHAAALRRECDSLPEWQRLRRHRAYRDAGYPPGVGGPWEAKAVDLARRLGGLTLPDMVRAGFGARNASRVARVLAGIGVLVPLGPVASHVRTKYRARVWRLDMRAEGAQRP